MSEDLYLPFRVSGMTLVLSGSRVLLEGLGSSLLARV